MEPHTGRASRQQAIWGTQGNLRSMHRGDSIRAAPTGGEVSRLMAERAVAGLLSGASLSSSESPSLCCIWPAQKRVRQGTAARLLSKDAGQWQHRTLQELGKGLQQGRQGRAPTSLQLRHALVLLLCSLDATAIAAGRQGRTF